MSKKIVELDGVEVSLGGRLVLKDISFTVMEGQFVGIIGPNGAGKTTLLRLILGLLRPVAGRVRVFGQDPLQLKERDALIGYLPQKAGVDLGFPLSAEDVILMNSPRRGFFRVTPWERTAANEIMERIGIQELGKRPIGQLSGGQQQLVFLARALWRRPQLLLLDEPTNGLDILAQDRFFRLVKELQAEMKLTVLMVSHDLAAITAHADELLCVNQGIHVHARPADMAVTELISSGCRCEYEALFGKRWGRGNG
jgi:zinc transport system ATP-binding protein